MIVQLHIMVHALKEALTTFLSCDLLLVYCLDITEGSIEVFIILINQHHLSPLNPIA